MSINTTKLTEVDVLAGTGTSTSAAATVNTQIGVITTESLSTASAGTYTFTLTNSLINANSIVNITIGKGSATTGGLVPVFCTPAAGSAVIILQNVTAAALNGTVKIFFSVLNLN